MKSTQVPAALLLALATLSGFAALPGLASCASSRGRGGLEVLQRRETESTAAYEYLVEYPAFPGHPKPTALVESIASAAIEGFIALSREDWEAWRATATEAELAAGRPPHQLRVAWHGERLDAEAISLYLEIYSFTGGAHGILELRSVNYDPRAGRFLELGDVVRNKSETWLEPLSARARAELAGRLATEGGPDLADWIDEGAGPDPDNYACFVFDADTVTIIFQKYQVAPGSAGAQFVTLQRDGLKLE